MPPFPLSPSPRIAAAAVTTAVSRSSSTAISASKSKGGGGGWLSSLFGGGAGAPKTHRPFNANETTHVRLATRKQDKVMKENPGARVEPSFVTAEEGKGLHAEAQEILAKYSVAHISDEQRKFMVSQMKHFPLPKQDLRALVNMQRVTGRFESDEQKLAPWGYGDEFKVEQLPPVFRQVLEKIQESEHFALGKPRDVTLNFRKDFFYRLDPHIDPIKDGGNVFILGLLSGTVLTLSPTSKTMHPSSFAHMDQRKVSEQSWLPGKDIDVDLPERGLLHLSGDARYTWNHGIRLGVTQHQIEDYYLGEEVPPEVLTIGREADAEGKHTLPLWDWFGSMKQLRPRGPERLSVIFAFGDPHTS